MNKIYRNRDFYLSSFLITKGCPLIGHSKENQTTTLFEFDETTALRNFVEQYYSMGANVEPMGYAAAIRSLKSVIHSNSNSKEHNNNGNIFNNK